MANLMLNQPSRYEYIPGDGDADIDLSERLQSRETITFVNSNHRNEQLRNENLVKTDDNVSSTVEYFEEKRIPRGASNVHHNFQNNNTNVSKNPQLYVTEIEKRLENQQCEEVNETLYELWRLQELISQYDSHISYYSILKEASVNQYYNYLDTYYMASGNTTQNTSNMQYHVQYDNSSVNQSIHNVTFDHEVQSNDAQQVQELENRYIQKTTKTSSGKNCEYWEGVLPKRKKLPGEVSPIQVYSRKVFVGGVPWDITEEQLRIAFGKFGNFIVQWPTRDSASSSTVRIKGYLYLIFDNKDSVKNLIEQIKESGAESNGGSVTFNYRIKCNRNKHVQIVPWLISDNYWEERVYDYDERMWTIFVGGLHGKLYAQALFTIFNNLFKNVISVKIDTDEYNYPTGSGSIRFSNRKSYIKAIIANYIEVKTSTLGPKSIEIQHYMEDEVCNVCQNAPGRKFCKTECFEYFCEMCWKRKHKMSTQHVAVSRHHKNKDGDCLY